METKTKGNLLGTVVGIALLAGTVFVISWAWKKGQK